jgi:lipid II isoglutaminyl synthase (glutamine-hydrolysing)
MERPRVEICWLYPELLNIYGDRGNVIVLEQRSRWHGLEPMVHHVSVGHDVAFTDFDLIMMGGGQDREQALITEDFARRKGTSLAEAVADGVSLLAVCGGYQLMGRYYRTHKGEVLPGLGIFDIWTEASSDRMIGNVVIESDIFGERKTIVGFENHGGKTYLGSGARPLGKVLRGFGNNGKDGMEGVVLKHSIGTYLHGSILPKNPHLADWLIQRALERRYRGQVRLGALTDELERQAHEAMTKRILQR